MKTAKEKAEELVLKYLRIDNNTKEWFNTHIAKQCALIAVDEVLFALKYDFNDPTSGSIRYWQEVKQEICNL